MATNLKLWTAIRERGLRQYQLANLAQISETTLSKILNGRTRPAEYVRIRIARVLQMPQEELFPSGQDRVPRTDDCAVFYESSLLHK